MRVVIFAYGNPSRGDDALAPLLLQNLKPQTDVSLVIDFQLQIEHALDLQHQDLALFIDADQSGARHCQLRQIHPASYSEYSSHAMQPSAILAIYQQHLNQKPPPAFLLSLPATDFTLGNGLSPTAQYALQKAEALLQSLCQHRNLAFWQTQASKYGA